MLTKGDDYPIHQTPEPVAYAGSDRNFYDRYFFNGYGPAGEQFFAIAFGIYPHLNIADAHFSVIRGETQHCLHASRYLMSERMDLSVGPIRIEVIEPLQKLRVIVSEQDGIAADLTFEGRAFPIEEPRFTLRHGPRIFMDYTRMTQNCRLTGWISVDGVKIEMPGGSTGTRDRSWGIRPVGARDEQPVAPPSLPAFFWQWTPLNFADRSVFFHINADGSGKPFNLRSVVARDGSDAAAHSETDDARLETTPDPGTRWPARGVLHIGADTTIALEPVARFQMKGIGYMNPHWGHGALRGPLVVEREDFATTTLDPLLIENMHVQMVVRATMRDSSTTHQGIGVFEQLVLGPYAPMGFATMTDGAG